MSDNGSVTLKEFFMAKGTIAIAAALVFTIILAVWVHFSDKDNGQIVIKQTEYQTQKKESPVQAPNKTDAEIEKDSVSGGSEQYAKIPAPVESDNRKTDSDVPASATETVKSKPIGNIDRLQQEDIAVQEEFVDNTVSSIEDNMEIEEPVGLADTSEPTEITEPTEFANHEEELSHMEDFMLNNPPADPKTAVEYEEREVN